MLIWKRTICTNKKFQVSNFEFANGKLKPRKIGALRALATQKLAAQFNIALREYLPDHPIYAILKRAAGDERLYRVDFLLMELMGVADSESSVKQFRSMRTILAWEQRTGMNWHDEERKFQALTDKYSVPLDEFMPDDPVFEILTKLDNNCELQPCELEILADRGAPELAGRLHEIRVAEIQLSAAANPNPRILAKIPGLWRKLERPDLALKATSRALDANNQPLWNFHPHHHAMLLTTRGGALRDTHDLSGARTCAQLSIRIRPKRGYAYCLLGAIEIQEGAIAVGEQNFMICEELEPKLNADNLRKGAIERAKSPSEYAAYLLDKDHRRFAWARKYLQR